MQLEVKLPHVLLPAVAKASSVEWLQHFPPVAEVSGYLCRPFSVYYRGYSVTWKMRVCFEFCKNTWTKWCWALCIASYLIQSLCWAFRLLWTLATIEAICLIFHKFSRYWLTSNQERTFLRCHRRSIIQLSVVAMVYIFNSVQIWSEYPFIVRRFTHFKNHTTTFYCRSAYPGNKLRIAPTRCKTWRVEGEWYQPSGISVFCSALIWSYCILCARQIRAALDARGLDPLAAENVFGAETTNAAYFFLHICRSWCKY